MCPRLALNSLAEDGPEHRILLLLLLERWDDRVYHHDLFM